MEAVNQDIKLIKEGMLAHNADDKVQFSAINDKLDRNHDLHIRNEEILRQILEQAKKTNGRVTSLEASFVNLDKGHALLHQIVSQQHNQYQNFVTQYEKIKEKSGDRQFGFAQHIVITLVTSCITITMAYLTIKVFGIKLI